MDGRPYSDAVLVDTNQEHGIMAVRSGSSGELPDLAVGDLVRVLPNHACATAAQYDRYNVIPEGSAAVSTAWMRFGGW
jgi:D-serine deaminase-like pyridoxal phosphate-dependent protein